MDETVEWLRGRPYYEGQIRAHEVRAGREPTFRSPPLDSRLSSALAERGIDALYAHQTRAVEAVRDGHNAVVATPTASGKSLAYTVPAFERAMDDRATALYVAPQVALVEDQQETMADLASELGFASGVTVEPYTGGLSDAEREAVRERQPTVLLTTPDMLHYGILPHARRLWSYLFERLATVVIDEVHEYRGVFGSHVALLLRRLARVADEFGADPDWLCCSATIDNPVEHAATVTGQPPSSFEAVTEDTSATGPRHWLFWNPPEYEGGGFGSERRRSNHVEARRLFVDLVDRGHRTVVFTGARQTAERYAADSERELRKRDGGEIAAYHGALDSERRRELERGLHAGDLDGVWATSALELGIDVGGLDCVVLDGYPGTRMSAFQRAGRAGRGTDPALVVLVGGEDQLDQYVMANRDALLDGGSERAVANPENDAVMPDHLRAAARERWLSPDDDAVFGDSFPKVVSGLEAAGDLNRRETDDGVRWTTAGSPAHDVSLRAIDDREVQLRDRRDGSTLATLSFGDALRDAHPGAVYHHGGQSFEVLDLDPELGVAELEPTWADYYTRVLTETSVTVERDIDGRALPARDDCTVRFADVTVREQVTGFERRDASSGESLGREALDLPETSLSTRALYYTVPDDVRAALLDAGGLPGAIHAAEHGMIAMFPSAVLCDRRDVGGLSTPRHPHTDTATVFVYDGHPGGVGLARDGYRDVADLLATTREMIRSCSCEGGCPACVQSPHCGNANDPLDKELAARLLEALT